MKAFTTGEGLRALEGIPELEEWLTEHGIQRGELPTRNLRQAAVIMEGLREYNRNDCIG